MLEEKIQTKRKQLNESIEKNGKYEDVYRLSVELDDLITEFYKKSKEKQRAKNILNRKGLKKILPEKLHEAADRGYDSEVA